MTTERFTIIGASGFIGSALMRYLSTQGHTVEGLDRNSLPAEGANLGHAIFSAGVTADFRNRLQDTVNAHVSYAHTLLSKYRFASFTYLSSARIYRQASHTREDAVFTLSPSDPDQIYDLSKLMGESLCLSAPNPSFRVVRLSNVAGLDMASENFLPSLIRDALKKNAIAFRCAPQSAKDYVMLEDVLSLLPKIALDGKDRIYNLASGHVTTASFIGEILTKTTGCEVTYANNAPLLVQPPVDIGKLKAEFAFEPMRLEAKLDELINAYRQAI